MKREYDIFISYRRDGGESTAKILRDKLTELGYSVFFDVESLRSGDFNKKLYSVIEECGDFIVVLSPGCLDRCVNEDDWVRLEIEHALEKNKNIIPVMLRGFAFPSSLPESIEPLRYKNGLESNYQFFDAFIEKLEEFLISRPSRTFFKGRGKKEGRRLGVIAATCALALLLVCVFVYRSIIAQTPYPSTQEERNLTDRLIYYAQQNLTQIEVAAGYTDDAYRECEAYLEHFDQSSGEAVLAALKQARMLLYGMDNEVAAMPEDLQKDLQGTPFLAADAAAMHDYLLAFCQGVIDNLYYMETIVSPDTPMDLAVREEVLECYQSMMEEELRYVGYCTNQMFLPVENQEAISAFKYDFLPELYYIPLRASEWIEDEAALISAQDSSMTAIEMSMERILLNVGDANREVMEQKSDLVRQYREAGMSAQEAEAAVEELVGQADLLTWKEAELSEAQKDLEASLAEARKKFAPLMEDDPDTLWGKMMRFLNLGLYEDAVTCMDLFREKMRKEDPYAEEYTAAVISLIRNIADTGIDYGLVVVGYDPEAPENEQYEIGDIIISLNGGLCRNFEEYDAQKALLSQDEDYRVVVLRRKEDGSGKLEQKELLIPADAPRVQIREISEKEYQEEP